MHSFYSGDTSGDFNILVKTTGYYDIGDGAEMGFIVGMKTILTVKDKRSRSAREADQVKTISYRENDSLLSDSGKQAILFFDEGKTDVAVEIATADGSLTIIKASFFGITDKIPEPVTVGNFPRGVLASNKSIQEELVLLDRYLELDSVGWVTGVIKRFATGYWFVNEHKVKGVSENGISKRMFEFLNSVDKTRYAQTFYWADLAIMYSSVVNPDSVEAFYLRYIIESPDLKYPEDNRQSLDLLKRRDYNEFLSLISDIINNPSAYADKSVMDSTSLVEIAKEARDSLPQQQY